MINDSLFDSTEDKTKFFDAIIPIVPIVDVNSSGDRFLELLKKEENKPSEYTIRKLSSYVNNMRIIKNIVNEYNWYKSTVNMDDLRLDHEKLFALVFLKNLFPKDFDLFLKDQGNIISILEAEFVNNNQRSKSHPILEYRTIAWGRDTLNNDDSNKYGIGIELKDFLNVLVKDNLIDRTYYFYKQIFSGFELSPKDMKFIKRVLENKKPILSVLHKLDNPKNVIKRLDIKDFENIYLVNKSIFLACFDMFYDIQTWKKLNKMLNTISNEGLWSLVIKILKNINKEDLEYIFEKLFIYRQDFLKLLFMWFDEKDLYHYRSNFCLFEILINILIRRHSSEINRKEWSIFFNIIKESRFFSACVINHVPNESKKSFVDAMKEKSVKFTFINISDIKQIQFIEDNELYLINIENSKKVYEVLHNTKINDEKEILFKIFESEHMMKTKEFIISNDSFVKEYFEEIETSILLNILNSQISENIKILCIKNSSEIVNDLNLINNIQDNNIVLDHLLINDRIEFNFENIRWYLEKTLNSQYINNNFIEYLNRNVDSVDFKSIFSKIDSSLLIDLKNDSNLSEEARKILQEID